MTDSYAIAREQELVIEKNIIRAFRTLFRVWDGTENADMILQDALRTVGSEVFGFNSFGLNKFEAECRKAENQPIKFGV